MDGKVPDALPEGFGIGDEIEEAFNEFCRFNSVPNPEPIPMKNPKGEEGMIVLVGHMVHETLFRVYHDAYLRGWSKGRAEKG